MWGITIDGALHAWGARAIYDWHTCYIDLLPDRQSWEPEPDKALLAWINRKGLPWLRKTVKKARPSSNSEEVFELVEGDYVLRASCRASYGYLYIGAAQLAAQPQEVTHGG